MSAAWTGWGIGATFALEVVVKATTLLTVASVLAVPFRRFSAAARHGLWLCALVAVLALPAGVALLPPFGVGVLPAPEQEAINASLPAESASLADVSSVPPSSLPQPGAYKEPPIEPPGRLLATEARAPRAEAPPALVPARSLVERVLGWAWLVGVSGWLAWLFIGLLVLRRVANAAQSLEGEDGWRHIVDEEAEIAGVRRRVRILRSSAAGAPVTWGVHTPTLLLPIESSAWSEERRRVVIRHELAHVARWDSLTQLVASVACGVYWFHPMVWWAAKRLQSEREHACDDRVLATGVRGSDYAIHLVELARTVSALRMPAVITAAMARSSELESRVVALLDPARRRGGRPTVVQTLLTGFVALGLVASLAAFRAVPRPGTEAESMRGEASVRRATLLGKTVPPAVDERASAPQDQQVAQVRDSAGVRIVELGAVGARAAPIRLSSAPIYRTPEGPSGSLRSNDNAFVFEDGSAAVVDALARQITFLSPTGVVEAVMSRARSEREDFGGIFSLSRIPGDTLVAQHGYPDGKLTLIHGRSVVRDVTVGPQVAENRVLGVGQGGELILGFPIRISGTRSTWLPVTLAAFDLGGERLDTIGSYDFAGPTSEVRFQLMGPAAVADGRLVVGRGDRPELKWFDPDGRLRQIARWEPPTRVVTDSAWLAYEERLRAGRRSDAWIRDRVAGLKATLDEAPVLWRLTGDSEGNVWIASHGVPDVDYWMPPAYDVVSAQGAWLGTVQMPRGFQVLWIGRDRILGAERDSANVWWLVMYRLER